MTRSPLREEPEIDRIAHTVTAEIARVQVITTVANRQHAGGELGVAPGLIEGDHGIEGAAVPDPTVHGLTRGFAPPSRRRAGRTRFRMA